MMAGARAFFFYGTLLDADVRAVVMGAGAPAEVEAATLAGWRRLAAPGSIFPIIVPAPGGAVDGALACALTPAAVAKLVAYEGPEYKTVDVAVTLASGAAAEAAVFVPVRATAAEGRRWDLAAWQRRHKQRFMARMRGQRGAVYHGG